MDKALKLSISVIAGSLVIAALFIYGKRDTSPAPLPSPPPIEKLKIPAPPPPKLDPFNQGLADGLARRPRDEKLWRESEEYRKGYRQGMRQSRNNRNVQRSILPSVQVEEEDQGWNMDGTNQLYS